MFFFGSLCGIIVNGSSVYVFGAYKYTHISTNIKNIKKSFSVRNRVKKSCNITSIVKIVNRAMYIILWLCLLCNRKHAVLLGSWILIVPRVPFLALLLSTVELQCLIQIMLLCTSLQMLQTSIYLYTKSGRIGYHLLFSSQIYFMTSMDLGTHVLILEMETVC